MKTKNAINVNKANFSEVKKLLEKGKSAFINRNNLQKMKLTRDYKELAEPWYFTHA